MRRVHRFMVLGLALGIACLSLFVQAGKVEGAETLTIIKDQAELRSAPRSGSKVKTLILRNTKVEWTGNRTGQWLEVKLPTGLQGWVLGSSLSLPAPAERPAPTEAPSQTKPSTPSTKPATPPNPTETEPSQEPATAPEAPAYAQPPSPELAEALKKKDEEINQLKQLLAGREAEVEALKKKDEEINQLKQLLAGREVEVKSKTDTIAQLTEEVNALKAKAAEVDALRAKITQAGQAGESTPGSLEEERNKVKNLENQVTELQNALAEKNKQVEALSAQNVSLAPQASQEEPDTNWAIYLVPVLLVLLIVLAVYAFRDRLPRGLTWKRSASLERFEEAGADLRVSPRAEDNLGKASAPASPATEGEDRTDPWAKKIRSEEEDLVSPEKNREAHTRRIESEPEAEADYRFRNHVPQAPSPSPAELESRKDLPLQEDRFDIRLVKVGEKRDKVLQMLSKVKGLVRSPEELLNAAPCTIAKNVEKSNAEKFRHYMDRVGATIELVKSEEEE